jgi:hypothetical protein
VLPKIGQAKNAGRARERPLQAGGVIQIDGHDLGTKLSESLGFVRMHIPRQGTGDKSPVRIAHDCPYKPSALRPGCTDDCDDFSVSHDYPFVFCFLFLAS